MNVIWFPDKLIIDKLGNPLKRPTGTFVIWFEDKSRLNKLFAPVNALAIVLLSPVLEIVMWRKFGKFANAFGWIRVGWIDKV